MIRDDGLDNLKSTPLNEPPDFPRRIETAPIRMHWKRLPGDERPNARDVVHVEVRYD